MKRLFSILLAGAMMFALTSCGTTGGSTDTAKMRIGIIQFAPHPSLDNCYNGLMEGLKELGYTEYNTIFDFQNANADMNLANTMAQKMVSDKCALIVAIATPAAQAVFNAAEGKNIPLVFVAVSDPMQAKIVKSLDKPETNVTGVSDVLGVDKQIFLVQSLLPNVKKLGVLYNSAEINSVNQVDALKLEVNENDYQLTTGTVSNVSEVNLALTNILGNAECMINVLDNTVVSAMQLMSDKCSEKGVPIIGSEEEQVANGALASYGFDYIKVGKQASVMASRVLKGEKASDIPVEMAEDFRVVINKKVAEKLNITIPDDIKAIATFVGE